jgi:hypothetical protein
MLAIGKIGWAICGILLVFVGNFFISILLIAALGQLPSKVIWNDIFDKQVWFACSIAFAKVFLWGLFWSTRCRTQMSAVLGSYATPMLLMGTFLYIVHYVLYINPNDTEIAITYFCLTQIVLVGFFAIWGVFRWFHYDTRRSLFAKIVVDHHFVLFRYPKTVQSPFFALVHHHIRHATITYPFGILCFIVWSLGCICLCVPGIDDYVSDNDWQNTLRAVVYITCLFGIFLFWGTIFGHDQRNDSYKFLSRMGVPAGTVWWSRMLPALPLYVFGGLCFLGYYYVDEMFYGKGFNVQLFWQELPLFILAWLAPIAIGSFVSISIRGQAASFIVTVAGTYVLFLWAFDWMYRLDISPLWTTLPICIALLVASRMRATYWLRDMFTWRTRLIPLVPVVGTVLVIGAVLWIVDVVHNPNQSRDRKVAMFDSQPSGCGSECGSSNPLPPSYHDRHSN